MIPPSTDHNRDFQRSSGHSTHPTILPKSYCLTSDNAFIFGGVFDMRHFFWTKFVFCNHSDPKIYFWRKCVCAGNCFLAQDVHYVGIWGLIIYLLQLRNHLYQGEAKGTSPSIIGIYLAIYPDKWPNTRQEPVGEWENNCYHFPAQWSDLHWLIRRRQHLFLMVIQAT